MRHKERLCLKCTSVVYPDLGEKLKVGLYDSCLCGNNLQLTDPEGYRSDYENKRNVNPNL